MFIESRFYDNGTAKVRLHTCETEPAITESSDYDCYIEDVDNLEEWIEDNMEIELDDITCFVLAFDMGKWVDITNFC